MKFWTILIMSVVLLPLVLQAGCEPKPAKAEKLNAEPSRTKPVAAPAKAAPQQSKTQKEDGNPSIKFSKTVHDFGKIDQDSYNNAVFEFSNVGDGTLRVERTKGTCKCTVSNLKKKEYAPGESGQLKVKFHAPKRAGKTSQHVMVFSNDKKNSKVELTIRADVVAKIEVAPERLSFSLEKPNAGAKKIRIRSLDGRAFSITGFKSKGNVVTAKFDPTETKTDFVLEPKVDMDKLRKNLNGSIEITLTHPGSKSVRVNYSTLAEFETTPATIIIRNAIAGEKISRRLTIISNYDKNIELKSVSSKSGSVKMVGKEKTENRFAIDLVITPPKPSNPKLRVFSDVIYIKLKGGKQINVNCRGFYSRIQK